jgi:agmatinase
MFDQSIIDFLVPPGNGVHTIHTAKERREGLHQSYYSTKEQDNVINQWKKSLDQIEQSQIIILGIPSDCGGGILRGANWGPLAIRSHMLNLLSAKDILDLGDIRVVPHLLSEDLLSDHARKKIQKFLYSDADTKRPVSPLGISYEVSKYIMQTFPEKSMVFLGGDHSISHPTVKAWLESRKKKCAILHFDAHTDLLESRMGVDYCFGTWASHIINLMPDPSLFLQLGIRSSGKNKAHWEQNFGITQIWANEFAKKDPISLTRPFFEHLKQKQVEEIYISFDIDCLDVQWASATGTPEPNGLAPHHVIPIIETFARDFQLSGFDLVEVAPNLNHQDQFENLSLEPRTTLDSASIVIEKAIEMMRERH